jgi:heme-degrading monooxygenase HmoA
MAVIMIDEIPGAGPELIDAMRAAGVLDKMRSAQGFRGHYSGESTAGYLIIELWDSPADWQAWFDGTIEPNLPAGVAVPAPSFTEVHMEVAPR